MEKPKSPDEAIAAYAQVAEKLGYGITEKDIREAIKQEETKRKAKIDKVVAGMEELEDDDLEGVAGGARPPKPSDGGNGFCGLIHMIVDILYIPYQ